MCEEDFNFKEYFERGIDNFNQNNIDEAEKNFRISIMILNRNGKRSKEAHNFHGLAYKKQNKIQLAKEEFNKSIEINRNFSNPYYNLADLFFQDNQYNDALKYYEKSVDCTDDFPEIAKAFYNIAIIYYQKNDMENSEKNIIRAIEKDHKFKEAFFKRGEIYLKKSEFSKASDDFKNAYSLDKNNYEAYIKRSFSLKNIKNNSEAIFCLDKAIEIKPDFEMPYIEKANLLYEMSDYENCLNSLFFIIQKFENNFEALLLKGKIESIKNEYNKAIDSFEKEKKINPDFYEIYYEEGMLIFRFEKLENAITELKSAITKNPEFLKSYQCLSEIYKIQENYDEALKNMKIVIEKEKKKENFFELNEIYFLMDNYDDALVNLEKAIEIDPDYSEAYNKMGIIYKKMNNIEKTEKNFKKAIEKDPSNIWANHNMGQFLVENKFLSEARNYIDVTIKLDPNNPQAIYLRGITKIENQENQALEDFDKAIEIGSKEPDLFYRKAVILEKSNKDDQALKAINEAIKYNPTSTVYNYKKGKLLMKKGDLNEAIDYIDKTIEIDPKNKYAYDLRGICLHKLNKPLKAIDEFNKALLIDDKFP